MPRYDYRCTSCKKRSVIFQTYAEYGRKKVKCPHCGGVEMQRLIGRVRIARSEESRLDELSDPSDWGDFDESDPRSMAKMMRKMGSELGEDMPGEFDEVVNRLEAGEDPDAIEESMPDLGGSDDGGDDFDF
ncbi:MAG: FmdB family zinc ribbon protein [Anaerolineales bacterium]